MKLWGDMTRLERDKAVLHLVRQRGLSYTEAAEQLVASKGAVAGTLNRLKHRKAPGRKPGDKQADKLSWTEQRLTESWAVWRERRRAERQREMTE